MAESTDPDYGYLAPLAPGAVDPVREAEYIAGLDAGWDPLGLTDPAAEALFGPEPGVDAAALFAALDDDQAADHDWSPTPSVPATDGVPDCVRVPRRMPSVEDALPGPELANVLDAVRLSDVGAYELVETVAGWQRLASWTAARQADAIVELSRRAEMRPTEAGRVIKSMTPQRVTGTEVAARLTLTPNDGDRMTARALFLAGVLPGTSAALRAGRIDIRRAEVIADVLHPHSVELAQAVEAEVLDRAEVLTAPRLRRVLIATLHRLDPSTMAERAEHAVDNRCERITPARDGMAWLEAYLPAGDAAALNAALDAAAAAMKHADPDDGRTMAQRRADALAQMGWLALSTGRLGGCQCGQRLATRHGRPVSVNITVPLSTLLGDDDQSADLAGYGPISAETARRLAAAGTWRRLVTDPLTGALLDYGSTTYRPPQELVDHVLARDGCCRWPGCDHPASAGDLDHTIPFPWGSTAAWDLGPFCKPHHIGKHHSRWKVRQPAPGRFEWISPTGHRYVVDPEPLGPIVDSGAGDRVRSDPLQPTPACVGPPDEPPF